MESFHWDKHFETGLDEVDKQHHHLVDVINRFGALLTQLQGVTFDDIETVFKELAAYAQYHFREEEELMAATGVDPRHVNYHVNEHDNFLKEATQMHATLAQDNRDASESLLKFLIYWLAYHILGSDQSMARQIKAIRSGQSAADAFQHEERIREGASEPLLIALNGLFRQISQRNRELLELARTLEAKIAERTNTLSKANRELAIANRSLEEIALTDVLTGLPNRRHALARLAQMWQESERNKAPLACMMIDADGFKQINDSYGHAAGDEVLRQLSRHLQHSVRTDDVVSRLGGDEFLIICPGTTLEGALHVAEQMRLALGKIPLMAGKGIWRGSISVGVAVRQPDMKNPEELIKAADQGVYAAKRNGRNRVECIASGVLPVNPRDVGSSAQSG